MTPESFQTTGWRGQIAGGYRPVDLDASLRLLTDPSAAQEILQDERNCLYSQTLVTQAEQVEVVVKRFSVQGRKAEESWRVAGYFVAHGISTAEPVMLIQSTDSTGLSFYVSRRVRRAFEARYFFRALEGRTEAAEFPRVDVEELLVTLGSTLRRMHDAQIWHRDVSIGNLLVSFEAAEGPPQVTILDLNRARVGRRVNVQRRTRDLCRLRIFERHHQETFLRAYWQGRERGFGFKRGFYRLCHGTFLAHNRLKGAGLRPL